MPAAEGVRRGALDWLKRNREADPQAAVEQLRNDYAQAFGSVEGRRVLIDIAIRGGMFQTSMQMPGAGDVTHFNEGRRDLALTIVQMARMTPADMIGLMTERIDAETAENLQPEENDE
jgi:hypothetical protein